MVVEAVFPVTVTAPGFLVNVQFPDGKPFKTTEPVEEAQVVWVIVPTVGADGVAGCGLITTLADAADVHPTALVTVNE